MYMRYVRVEWKSNRFRTDLFIILHIYEREEHIQHTSKAINWYARTQTIHIFLTDYEKGVKIQRKAKSVKQRHCFSSEPKERC